MKESGVQIAENWLINKEKWCLVQNRMQEKRAICSVIAVQRIIDPGHYNSTLKSYLQTSFTECFTTWLRLGRVKVSVRVRFICHFWYNLESSGKRISLKNSLPQIALWAWDLLNGARKTHAECGWHHFLSIPWDWGGKRAHWAQACTHPLSCAWLSSPKPLLLWLPCCDGLAPGIVSRNKPFLTTSQSCFGQDILSQQESELSL